MSTTTEIYNSYFKIPNISKFDPDELYNIDNINGYIKSLCLLITENKILNSILSIPKKNNEHKNYITYIRLSLKELIFCLTLLENKDKIDEIFLLLFKSTTFENANENSVNILVSSHNGITQYKTNIESSGDEMLIIYCNSDEKKEDIYSFLGKDNELSQKLDIFFDKTRNNNRLGIFVRNHKVCLVNVLK